MYDSWTDFHFGRDSYTTVRTVLLSDFFEVFCVNEHHRYLVIYIVVLTRNVIRITAYRIAITLGVLAFNEVVAI